MFSHIYFFIERTKLKHGVTKAIFRANHLMPHTPAREKKINSVIQKHTLSLEINQIK